MPSKRFSKLFEWQQSSNAGSSKMQLMCTVTENRPNAVQLCVEAT